MRQAFITVTIPFDARCADDVERAIGELGNPARGAVRAALMRTRILHFVSLVVVPGEPGDAAHLLLEASADGSEAGALAAIAEHFGPYLAPVLAAAGITAPQGIDALLDGHQRTIGPAWWSTSGLCFSGTPGMSVQRIRREALLARRIALVLELQPPGWSPMARLQAARDAIWQRGDAKWAFQAEPAACLAGAPQSGISPLARLLFGDAVARAPLDPIRGARTLWRILLSGVATFLWPVAAVLALAFVGTWLVRDWRAALVTVLLLGLVVFPLLGLALSVKAYVTLRRREESDPPEDAEPGDTFVASVMRHETFHAQNLLYSVSPLKPGRLRRVLLRLAFWSVGLVPHFCRAGFLGSNRVIHFARWLVVPGTDKLVFLSNYDGTWEGYVGDFVTNAAGAHGVTSIWSNCAGFPRTRDLVFDGAADRARLVRWARRQQRPVPFWFCAYPALSTDRIRTNAAIRQGLAAATSRADAEDWLACFGSMPRPADTLETAEMPTLLFGGLRRLRHASCRLITLGGDAESARRWLNAMAPRITYGEAGTTTAAVLALGATALRKLALPEDVLATFPVSFQQGMAAPHRARAIGDVGAHDPANWRWGGPQTPPPDALVVLYGDTSSRLAAAEGEVDALTRGCGHATTMCQPLAPLPDEAVERWVREPFGFVDGVSQPALRGTARARRAAPHDVLEPGELVLGYADQSGRLPPTPSVAAHCDPRHVLTDLGWDARRQRPDFARSEATGRRDLGRNGTYLVVRQLDQDVARFNRCLDALAADRQAVTWLPGSFAARRELIAAKLVGRWRNGTSLVRHPLRSGCNPDNGFLFGAEDAAGTRCPLGAHIRRANPRDGLVPGSREQFATTNTHRMLRVGRPYAARDDANPGLVFMCLVSDIERQFEFVQGSWLQNRRLHGLENEVDPLLGHGGSCRSFQIPTGERPLVLRGFADFVRPLGGGYFFVPGRTALAFLARDGVW